MNARTALPRKLADAGRQMREYERGLIQIITESGNVAEAIELSGYSYVDIKAMGERHGVSL